MSYLGDFTTGKTIHHKFMTVNASGKPTTLGDSPSLVVYANSSVSGVASGLTLTTDFDSKTGLNHVQFLATTSVTGVTSGTEYQICVATGSVSGISLAGLPICDFSLMNRSALRPATPDRTLLVSSTGYAGIDWNAIGTPGATQSLSATTLFTVTNVTNDVGAIVTSINTIAPARITAQGIDVGAIVTAINTIAPARVTAQGIDIGAVVTAISTIAPARVTAQGIDIGAIVTACNTVVPANVTAASINVGAVVTAVNTVTPARVTAFSAASLTVLAAAVWDQTLADVVDAGSTGEALNSAGAAGDPWTTAIPGAYTASQAGFIVGSTIQAGVTAIKAKVTALTFTVAGQVDANIESVNGTTVTGSGTAGDPWGP